MKNVLKHSKKGILMVTLFVTLLSFANEVPFFTVKNEANMTSLTLENVKEGNLLSILDKNGIILYKELIQKTGIYTKDFDLTLLPDGEYLFELDKDVEIITIPFKVNKSNVVFNKALEKTIFKPIVRVSGNLVYITKLSLKEEPLKIDVFFEDAVHTKLMLSETIKDDKTIERVYRLSGLNKGNYKIVFQSEGREFIEKI